MSQSDVLTPEERVHVELEREVSGCPLVAVVDRLGARIEKMSQRDEKLAALVTEWRLTEDECEAICEPSDHGLLADELEATLEKP